MGKRISNMLHQSCYIIALGKEVKKGMIARCQAPLSSCLCHPGHTCDFVGVMSRPPMHAHNAYPGITYCLWWSGRMKLNLNFPTWSLKFPFNQCYWKIKHLIWSVKMMSNMAVIESKQTKTGHIDSRCLMY